jgi:hypothetical protein
MRPNLQSFALELEKTAAPQGLLRAIRERGLRRVLKEYANHSALNAGQAVRDAKHFLSHPHADAKAAKGTLRHKLESAKLRTKSIANNAYYATIPPHGHHERADLADWNMPSIKDEFLEALKWKPKS